MIPEAPIPRENEDLRLYSQRVARWADQTPEQVGARLDGLIQVLLRQAQDRSDTFLAHELEKLLDD